MATRYSDFVDGARATLPLLLGMVPFGMIFGVAAAGIGLAEEMAVFMSLVIFAGASQLAVIQLVGADATASVIVLTALVINLRFLMYSASLAPHWSHVPVRTKGPLAYLLTDHAYAVSINRYAKDEPVREMWYYAGSALSVWVTWQLATVAGVVLGSSVPPSWGLDFAIPLTFIALLVPGISDRPVLVAALVSAGVAVAAYTLPYNLGLIAAAVCGMAAGLLTEQQAAATSA